jgi:hypothetical protein
MVSARGLAPRTSTLRRRACKALTPCGRIKMVGHRGYAPRISPIRTARISIFLMPVKELVERPGIAPGVSCLPDRRILFLPHARIIGRVSGTRTRGLTVPNRPCSLLHHHPHEWSRVWESHPAGRRRPRIYSPCRLFNDLPRKETGGGCRLCSDHLLLARQALS